jgi:diadenosine tetraphosphate (Ap4A) HIT family hydrolase
LKGALDSFSFLDISPLSKGHALVIPKCQLSSRASIVCSPIIADHAAKMHELPDEYLADMMPLAKKVANAQGLENYNVLQVNFG